MKREGDGAKSWPQYVVYEQRKATEKVACKTTIISTRYFFEQEGRHYDFDIPLGKNSGKFSKVKFCDDQSLARRLLILLLKFRI